jgi:hypothetical protein
VHATCPSPSSSVVIKRCGSSTNGNVLTHIHISGLCKDVLIEGCQRIVVLLDGVAQKMVISGCDQVRVALAGDVCKEILVRSSPRSIMHSIEQRTSTSVESVASPGSGFILAPGASVQAPATPENILACPQGSQVILQPNSTKKMVEGKVADTPQEKQAREQKEAAAREAAAKKAAEERAAAEAAARAAKEKKMQEAKQRQEEERRLQEEMRRKQQLQRAQEEAAKKSAAEQAAVRKSQTDMQRIHFPRDMTVVMNFEDFVCVCVYVCMYVCMYVCVCVYIHACMCVCM